MLENEEENVYIAPLYFSANRIQFIPIVNVIWRTMFIKRTLTICVHDSPYTIMAEADGR